LWYAVSALVIVVVAAGSAALVLSWLFQMQASDTRTYPNAEIRAVRVEAGSASVTVHAGPAGQAAVSEKLRWLTTRPIVSQSLDASTGTLTISAPCDSTEILGIGDCSVALDVQVPADAAIDVQISSGEAAISAFRAAVQVRTDSGAITLDNLAGPVQAWTASGAISGENLSSSTASATTDAGSVDLTFASAPRTVSAKADAGAVNITVPHGEQYRVSASSDDNGAVAVDDGLAAEAAQNSIVATTMSGAISISYG
jgi:hypothetical protein